MRPKRVRNRLPNKPSKLLRLALSDLRLTERAKTRKVDMTVWWRDEAQGTCVACLAGSTMLRTEHPKALDRVAAQCGLSLWNSGLPDTRVDKYEALNHLRMGDMERFLILLGRSYTVARSVEATWYLRLPCAGGADFPDYHDDPEVWWECMRHAVQVLERAGL